ncbi:hypothetical protein Ddc_06679 [Ditylenchus destructor]|nr:hypothetical protein Ddc_06679 [Ditylenchus destructor]
MPYGQVVRTRLRTAAIPPVGKWKRFPKLVFVSGKCPWWLPCGRAVSLEASLPQLLYSVNELEGGCASGLALKSHPARQQLRQMADYTSQRVLLPVPLFEQCQMGHIHSRKTWMMGACRLHQHKAVKKNEHFV